MVTIAIEPNETFQRQGDDLVCRLDVDALDAILGTTVEMPGILEGEVVTIDYSWKLFMADCVLYFVMGSMPVM